MSLGGATEAAIWSNEFILSGDGALPAGWPSVPYGRPLRDQSMLILDDGATPCGADGARAPLAHCAPWAVGVIYIGGAGVAHGYHRDPARSARQFVRHPRTGEKLFRTGDLGRLRDDGLLEILGREDAQVKVNGFRVELGEVRSHRVLFVLLGVLVCSFVIVCPTV